MHFTSEQRLDDGVLERGFTLGEIPGVLWTPTSAPVPLILVSSAYWGGLVGWMKETMFQKFGNVSPDDLGLLHIADTADEVAEHVLNFYSRHALQPNF